MWHVQTLRHHGMVTFNSSSVAESDISLFTSFSMLVSPPRTTVTPLKVSPGAARTPERRHWAKP